MQAALDSLISILDLEEIETNLFRGRSPQEDRQRVFGGQVAGQALVAACRTVEERQVHSLQAYFLRPGDPTIPIVYQVERIRDGRSFATRRVTAIQHGRAIFALSAYGLALVWGVMNVKNLSQGDFVIMGGYIAWMLGNWGIHPLFGLPAAVVVMSRKKADELGIAPLARFLGFAVGGVPPEVMGIGPVKAIPKALKYAGLALEDIDLIELNEAFAAQVLSVVHTLELDQERMNVNGGAIALGHPIGCSGARIVVTLLHEMVRRQSRLGLATLCVSGGMGGAMIVEQVPPEG